MVLSGTLFRAWFGLYHQFWNQSPDQLMWEWVISDFSAFGFSGMHQLMHYPHEGGSLILSLLALAFRSLPDWLPALSWATLFADSVARYVQIRITYSLWGFHPALFFGIVSVVSGFPLMLPWATVNFGLHALASFIPFVLCYFIAFRQSPVSIGILSGLAVSFSYDSIVFLPFCLFTLVYFNRQKGDQLTGALRYLAAFAITLIPHLFMRLFCDTGFDLSGKSLLSVRGAEREFGIGLDFFTRFADTWKNSLPASFFLNAIHAVYPDRLCVVVLCVILAGFGLSLYGKNTRSRSIPGMLLILCFTALYAASPIFSPDRGQTSYVYYRHMAYVAPLCCALVFAGFSSAGRAGIIISVLITACCLLFTYGYVRNTAVRSGVLIRNAGWALGGKYGHNPAMLTRVASQAPDTAGHEVYIGAGWGITAAMLEWKEAGDHAAVDSLATLFGRYPRAMQSYMREGFEFAFSPGVTPVLDPELRRYFSTAYGETAAPLP
jgi:hypothetical protein